MEIKIISNDYPCLKLSTTEHPTQSNQSKSNKKPKLSESRVSDVICRVCKRNMQIFDHGTRLQIFIWSQIIVHTHMLGVIFSLKPIYMSMTEFVFSRLCIWLVVHVIYLSHTTCTQLHTPQQFFRFKIQLGLKALAKS